MNCSTPMQAFERVYFRFHVLPEMGNMVTKYPETTVNRVTKACKCHLVLVVEQRVQIETGVCEKLYVVRHLF